MKKLNGWLVVMVAFISIIIGGNVLAAENSENVVEGTVVVSYFNESKEKISEDKVIKAPIGTSYKEDVINIDGYNSQEIPANASGVVTMDPQYVTFIYTNKSFISVFYKDQTGNSIKKETMITGVIGSPYTVEIPTIRGYTIKETPSNDKGTFPYGHEVVEIIYEKNQDTVGTVTVMYRDPSGNKLLPDKVLVGKLGSPYSEKGPKIEKYALYMIPENTNGTFTEGNQIVDFMYIDKMLAWVHYLTEDGTELKHYDTYEGKIDSAYSYEIPTFEGYTVKEVPENIKGVYADDPQVINIIYVKNKEVSLGTTNQTPPPAKPIVKDNVVSASFFPKTGEKLNITLTVFGIVLVTVAIYLRKKIKVA